MQLLRQQVELIGAEGVELEFEDEAVREIARMAAQLNKTVENIGARRLHTVLERIMETISFDAAEMEQGEVSFLCCNCIYELLATTDTADLVTESNCRQGSCARKVERYNDESRRI